MVRRKPWRPIRNAFHYECDILDNAAARFSGSFDMNYCTAYNGATASNGRLMLTGDGSTYPYAILPLPEQAKGLGNARANGKIFTAQMQFLFASSPVDVQEVVTAGEALRMYILDQFMDKNNPLGFIQITALAVAAGAQYATVQCEAMDNGSYNVDTYGGNFQIWDNTGGTPALYQPVTAELRLDMRGLDRWKLNYTLGHPHGANGLWATVEDDMFELMSAAELDCDNRRPAYIMFEMVTDGGDPPEHDLSAPSEGDLVCIWGIHFAEDPYILVGNRGANLITQGLGIARPVQAYPHGISQHLPQPVIPHAIDNSMLLSDSGIGDAISGRWEDMTHNQGYSKIIIGPLCEHDDNLGGDYVTLSTQLRAAYASMFATIKDNYRNVIVCGVLPSGDLAHVGSYRVAAKRACFCALNRWLAQECRRYGWSFVDVHDLLNESNTENTVAYDRYGYTLPATAWTFTGLFPDSATGFGMLTREVAKALDRNRRRHTWRR